ncbi:MAG: hypothetical protein J6I84_04395 [Bacilli bacterium]|nr:hypothetical protein [Bacilli bacterium]
MENELLSKKQILISYRGNKKRSFSGYIQHIGPLKTKITKDRKEATIFSDLSSLFLAIKVTPGRTKTKNLSES